MREYRDRHDGFSPFDKLKVTGDETRFSGGFECGQEPPYVCAVDRAVIDRACDVCAAVAHGADADRRCLAGPYERDREIASVRSVVHERDRAAAACR